MPFKSFSLPSPGGEFLLASDEELAGQDIVRQEIVNAVNADADSELFAQGKARQTISRAITRPVDQEIKQVGKIRNGLSSLVSTAIDQELGYQDAARTTIGNALLVAPGNIPRPRSGRFSPVDTTFHIPRSQPGSLPPVGILPPGPAPVPAVSGSGTGAIPPGSPDGIYLVCFPQDPSPGATPSTWTPIFIYQGVTAITGYAQWQGPFGASYADVVNNPAYNALLGTPCYTGTTGGPPVCPIPPPCPVTPPGDWYCVTYPDGTTGVEEIPGLPPNSGNSTLNDGSQIQGPYSTQADAQLACQQLAPPAPSCAAASCEAINAHPPDLTPVEPGPKCKLIDFGDWTFPPIGSDEFCKALAQIIQKITEAGQAFLEWIRKVKDDLSDWIDWLQTAQPGEITGFKVVDIAITLLAQTAGNFQRILWDILAQAVECYMDLASRFPGCNPTSTVALMVLKTLLSSLHNQRIGSDAGLWWTLDMSTRIPQWERLLDYLIEYLCPSVIPSVGEAITTWQQGQITADQRDCWMKMHGVSPDVWDPVMIGMAHTASAHDLIYFNRRIGANDADTHDVLIRHGWTREEDRVVTVELYNELPSLSQYMSMVRRDALDNDLADAWGLDTGFDDLWGGQVGQDLFAQGVKEQTARWEYRMTWAVPSINLAREFSWRARTDVVGEEGAFTDADWDNVLAFGNVPDYAQAWHTLIRYRPLSPSEVQQLVIWNLASPDRIQGAILDSGISPGDASLLTELETQRTNREAAAQQQGWTLARVVPMVRSGLMPIEAAYQLLQGQGYSNANVEKAVAANSAAYQQRLLERGAMRARTQLQRAALSSYEIGTIERDEAMAILRSTGTDVASAETAIGAVDLKGQQQMVKQLLAMIRSEYLKGVLTDEQVTYYLQAAGLTPDAVNRYHTVWQMQHTANRKLLSAQQAIRMVLEGVMPAGEAARRLANMGWRDPDRQLLLAEVSQKIATAQAKMLAAEEKAAERQAARAAAAALRSQRAAERQARAVAVAQKQALADLQKEQKRVEQLLKENYPKSELKAWLKQGLITQSFVQQVLSAEGYTNQAITLLIEEWLKEVPSAPISAPG